MGTGELVEALVKGVEQARPGLLQRLHDEKDRRAQASVSLWHRLVAPSNVEPSNPEAATSDTPASDHHATSTPSAVFTFGF